MPILIMWLNIMSDKFGEKGHGMVRSYLLRPIFSVSSVVIIKEGLLVESVALFREFLSS